ncbi:hypothetical protein Poly51_56730 [Rubripirellula tenax]|uniref:Uncharacterized protein n=2 Tax=Rubripirellula tenax TaxID=2528015 RepID=A0A5C6EE51_9BACT|nr:hypothetical protein Poly51_56730 [Rubripirellula tenax]
MLAVMVATLFGVPSMGRFDRQSASKTEERFPCEDCPCGCSTAEYCWDKCCCHSDREKLRWAAKNAVKPPRFLVKRVADADSVLACTISATNDDGKVSSCCCCAKKPTPKPTKDSVADDSTIGTSVVLIWKAAECRGLKSLWTLLSTALIEVKSLSMDPGTAIVDRIVFQDHFLLGRVDHPDPPVP